jgi:hypothetical protein
MCTAFASSGVNRRAADRVDAVVVTDKQGIVVDMPVAYNDSQTQK